MGSTAVMHLFLLFDFIGFDILNESEGMAAGSDLELQISESPVSFSRSMIQVGVSCGFHIHSPRFLIHDILIDGFRVDRSLPDIYGLLCGSQIKNTQEMIVRMKILVGS